MSISVFPVPVASTLNASAITAAAANTMYEGRATFDAAVYQITCASGVITNFQFFSGVTSVISGVTASGTVSINLASAADRIRLYTNTGTNTVVTINKTAAALTNAFSGTLDTITTLGTSTYTGTSTSGYAYAVLVGGGGGGGGNQLNDNPGSGGGSGAIAAKYLALTGSMSVTIGAGGAGGAGNQTTNATSGVSGGTSTFGGMTATGGTGGNGGNYGGAGGTASGGDINIGGAGGSYGAGGATASVYPFIFNAAATTGAGGGGRGRQQSGTTAGGGSGIGTGGLGGRPGGNATGYGAGGGGGSGAYSDVAYAGGNGTQGVLYVLRFFIQYCFGNPASQVI